MNKTDERTAMVEAAKEVWAGWYNESFDTKTPDLRATH